MEDEPCKNQRKLKEKVKENSIKKIKDLLILLIPHTRFLLTRMLSVFVVSCQTPTFYCRLAGAYSTGYHGCIMSNSNILLSACWSIFNGLPWLHRLLLSRTC